MERKGERFRHVRSLGVLDPNETLVERQTALVAAGGGERAAAKAREVAEILRRDFGFELQPAGGPLLGAGRETLRQAVESSLRSCGRRHRWFLYFAGQDRDFDLDRLLPRCLECGCGEILVVVDAGAAGQVLRHPRYMPRIDPERGPVQVVATAGPEDGETDLTRCLLDALAGRAGVHEDDGSLRFTGLKDYVSNAGDAAPGGRPFVAQELRQSPEGSVKGDFRFRRHWPYLAPGLVKDLRREDEEVRLGALAKLAGLYEPPEEGRFPEWLVRNLSGATWLVAASGPAGPLEEVAERLRGAVIPGGRKLRVQAAHTLGRLAAFPPDPGRGEALPRPVETLLHLAVRDRDGAVRFAAGLALRQALGKMEQLAAGHRLEELRRGASPRLRSRLARAAFWLPHWHRCLPVARRALGYFVAIGLGLGWFWRWVFHHKWRHRLARAIPLMAGAPYAFLLSSYYLGTEHLTEDLRRRNLVLRRGRPGFTALPGIGDDVVVTRFTVDDLTDTGFATEHRPIGSWFQWRDGALDWGHRLAAWLSPHEALLLYWRLGDRDAALEKLERDLAAGDPRSIEAAVYMAGLDGAAFEGVVERLSRVAEETDEGLAEAARRGLDSLTSVPVEEAPASERAAVAAPPAAREAVAGDLSTLVEETANDDVEKRGDGVFALARLALERRASAEAVEPYLREALHDREAWVRREAAEGILLLNASAADVYEAASEEFFGPVFDGQRRYPYALAGFTPSFERSTAAAAARFGNRLLSRLPTVETGSSYPYFEAWRALVRSRPEALADLVPGLTEILTLSHEDQLVRETGEHLKRLGSEDGLDLAPLAHRFLDRLANGTDRERRAAAVVLGNLTEGSEELAARVLGELERAMADPDPEVAARIGISLYAVALQHEALCERATSLLIQGLADERPLVRSAHAWSLSVVAGGGVPAPDPLPSVIWSALESPEGETRRRVAQALRRWSDRNQVWAEKAGARLALENDLLVRIELAAILGRTAGLGDAVIDRILPVFEAGLTSGEEEPSKYSIGYLRTLAVEKSSLARRTVTLLEDHYREHPSLHRKLTVTVITDIGKAHPEGAEVALVALERILFEAGDGGGIPDRGLWTSTIRALKSLGETRPLEVPQILEILERGRRWVEPRHVDFRSNTERDMEEIDAARVWEVWVDLAAATAAGDLDLLWEKLESRYSTHRLVALELVRRLAAERPELVPALRAGLEERRRDRRPHVRVAAAEGWERLPHSR